jgi:hypothetical protein
VCDILVLEVKKGGGKMNTEKMVIWEKNNKSSTPKYFNNVLGFKGSIEEAQEYAIRHNFGGGVEIARREGKRVIYTRV